MSEVSTRLSSVLADRYRIEREIGSGGMATVFLAHDLKHDRDVALKVLRPELAAVLGGQRFLNEISINARLDHPHILTLIDSGAADGFLYYVMPFVRGESLRAKVDRERQLRLDEALDITRQIASALDYAHRQGVVHRDIKPENILLHEGLAVLADFGIAMAVKDATGDRLTESGMSLGTPQYMSPEQAAGDRTVDARSDVYSLAAVLYEMIAGEPPITGATAQSMIAKLMTETPTRLRVLRPVVPESVDEAIATALAKVPADRHATAGDFGRALTTRVGSRRLSMATVRWRPLAILGAVVAIAAAGFLLARRPAPTSLPDRVQLTLTGNAIAPSLSPDGTRLAFAEKQCDAAASCTFQLVIQDVDGTGRLVLTRDIGYIYKTKWTSDGRFVAFAGSHPPLRHGAFAVSTLGGATRFLGCCAFDMVSGDTSYLHDATPQSSRRLWVRRVTVHDGRLVDSLPLGDTSAAYVVGLTVPDRLLTLQRELSDAGAELRLTDFRGSIVDSITPAFATFGRGYRPLWIPSKERLVFAAQREPGGTEFDVLATRVTASGIGPRIDTVLTGVELGTGIFDVSQDGERLVYYSGPVETTVATIDVDRRTSRLGGTTEILAATTRLRGRVSSTGERVLLARAAPRIGTHASQFAMIAPAGGSEWQIPGVVEQLVDFEWSPGGATFLYLHGVGGDQVRLVERDTSGRETREITRLARSAAVKIQPLSSGAIALLQERRRSISIIRRPGERDVTWPVPAWIRLVGRISPSPDARSLAIGGINTGNDSVVFATLDIETGRFTKLGSLAGSDPHDLTWLDDGSIVSVLREPKGAWAFDRIRPGRPSERLGALPHAEAEFSVSGDGARVVVFSYRDRNDVYMIRNFGRLLR